MLDLTEASKYATLVLDLTEALEAAMEHMKEMDWEAILEQEDMNREGFEYIDDEEESVFKVEYKICRKNKKANVSF